MKFRSRALNRLGSAYIWSWGFLAFSLPIYALLSLLFDAVILENYSIIWVAVWLAAEAIQVGLAVVFKYLTIDRYMVWTPRPGVALAIAGFLGAQRNVMVAVLANAFGVEVIGDYLYRVVGGASIGIGLLFIYALGFGSRLEHREIISRLFAARETMLAYRSNIKNLVADENAKILKQAQDELLPRLDRIKKMLEDGSTLQQPIEELRSLVNNQLRPLSRALSELPNTSAVTVIKRMDAPSIKGTYLKSVRPASLIRPLGAFAIVGPGTFLTAQLVLGLQAAETVMYGVALSFVVVLIVKWMLRRVTSMPRASALRLIGAIAFVSAVPSYSFAVEFATTTSHFILLLFFFLINYGSIFGLAITEALDQDRQAAEEEIRRQNETLEIEKSLFEQQLWISRRNWSFVLHGSVQAALTAAITRLSSTTPFEPHHLMLVQEDLNRAVAALRETPVAEVDLQRASRELVETWRGVAAITWDVTLRAQRALREDANARLCVNEIAKEAVSNAVRHGQAKNIAILIDRDHNEVLLMRVTNDGLAPKPIENVGLGLKMMDDLTMKWSLEYKSNIKRTVLSAEIPTKLHAGQASRELTA